MATLTEALTARLNHREHPSGNSDTRAHASESGKCARAVWYRTQQMPPSDPHPLTTLLSFTIGSHLHLAVQAALADLYPDTQLEVAWTLGQVSGHADALYGGPRGHQIVAEIKTAGPFAWKYMSSPKREHVLQASVNALALEAISIHIIYLNIAAKSGDDPIREFLLSIHIIYLNIAAKSGDDPIREFLLPVDRATALEEFNRLARIAAAPELVEPEYEGRVVHPDYDKFPCGWCGWRARCAGSDE